MPTPSDKARKRKTASYIGAGVVTPNPIPNPAPEEPENGDSGDD